MRGISNWAVLIYIVLALLIGFSISAYVIMSVYLAIKRAIDRWQSSRS